MPRKPVLLLHLLNQVLRPIAGRTSAQSYQLVALPQHPPDRDAWRTFWKAQDQPWRTEPEIDKKRQEYLTQLRVILPDTKQGIYPFKGIKLNRADVEWLLATHENGRGPVDWNDERQRYRQGLDLRGADLCQADLQSLPLARMCGGLIYYSGISETMEQLKVAGVHLEQTDLRWAHLEGAFLRDAHLEQTSLRWALMEAADLSWAHLEEADLRSAHLENVYLFEAHLERADLRGTYLKEAYLLQAHLNNTRLSQIHLEGALLENITLSDEKYIGPRLADVDWGNVNLAVVKWPQVHILGDEYEARQKKRDGRVKDEVTRLNEYEAAVRANRQLAVALQDQGLNEVGTRFAYRAQVLQKYVFWLQMTQHDMKLRQRLQVLGAWLFSWFLFLIAGYGYRLWRSFLVYLLVVVGFATAYHFLGPLGGSSLSPVNAIALSMTSFHGRGFFPGVTQLNDTLTILASIEAFLGLVLEVSLIATLTQRFFGK